MAPTADLTVNSLTATSFVQTPLLQSAAADLQIRNATTTLRAEDGTLVASFAAGSIGLEQDITVRSDRTLNATTADFAQFFVGSTAATGAFTSTDVFTREVATKALPDKRAETVTAAAAEIIPGLVQEEGNYVVTTDLGNEFRGLEEALPEGVVHRQKDPTDRNATAVVDRAIQTLKKDLAGKVARDGGGWAEHVDEATEAYNARPHEAVTVAPEDVETKPAATFRVYQDNAQAQRRADEEPSAAARGGGGIPGPHQCGEELPAPVWSGAGGFELRLDDGASHGWLGDFVEAGASGASGLGGAKGTADEAARAAGGAAVEGL